MPPNRPNLSKIASTALPQENGKLHAPSAVRNRDAIVKAIKTFMPDSGKALEIASGTGEHVVRYAAAFPNIDWQPTDIEQDRLDSVAAWAAETGLDNISSPVFLDASHPGWADTYSGFDVIVLSNLLHLIGNAEAHVILTQSTQALAPGGVFLIYGPFLRGTEFAGEGDRNFHESLRSKDPDIGYKSYQFVQDSLAAAGLMHVDQINMPSNNLILVHQKAQ